MQIHVTFAYLMGMIRKNNLFISSQHLFQCTRLKLHFVFFNKFLVHPSTFQWRIHEIQPENYSERFQEMFVVIYVAFQVKKIILFFKYNDNDKTILKKFGDLIFNLV